MDTPVERTENEKRTLRHVLPAVVCMLVLLAVVWLFSGGKEYEEFVAEHGHVHVAPNGGVLFALGDHFAHLEILPDFTTGTVRAFILDGHAESPVRLTNESLVIDVRTNERSEWISVPFSAVASPLSGEDVGDTSMFQGQASELKSLDRFQIRIAGWEIRGTPIEEIIAWYPEGNE